MLRLPGQMEKRSSVFSFLKFPIWSFLGRGGNLICRISSLFLLEWLSTVIGEGKFVSSASCFFDLFVIIVLFTILITISLPPSQMDGGQARCMFSFYVYIIYI